MAVCVDTLKTLHLPLEEALLSPLTNPRGGFTDVGLHTGGHARDTSWAILESVVQVLIVDNNRLMTLVMAQLKLWLTEMNLARIPRNGASAMQANRIMEMLTSTVEEGASLADDEYDMTVMAPFEARCAAVRYELELASDARFLHATRRLDPKLTENDFVIRNPKLSLEQIQTAPGANTNSLEDRQRIAYANLDWLPSPLKPSASWIDVLKWLEEDWLQPGSSPVQVRTRSSMQLVCTNVEKFFYSRASNLILDECGDTAEDLQRIESVVEKYRQAVRELTKMYVGMEARLEVEFRSRELLVVWLAYCMAHKRTNCEYDILNKYGVGLRESDLQFLVLFDKRAVDAALTVAKYLRACSFKGEPIFSLRGTDKTFQLAKEFALSSNIMQKTWKEETIAASSRREDRWLEVERKQNAVRCSKFNK